MCCFFIILFFFFKQKTAYEMRISDWSSDVCSSDLDVFGRPASGIDQAPARRQIIWRNEVFWAEIEPIQPQATLPAFRFAGIRQKIRPTYLYLDDGATSAPNPNHLGLLYAAGANQLSANNPNPITHIQSSHYPPNLDRPTAP